MFPWSKQDGHELKNWSWIVIPLPRLLNSLLMHGVVAKSRMEITSSRRYFGDCRCAKIGVDMGLDPFESRVDKLSIESRTAPICLHMRPGRVSRLEGVLLSKSSLRVCPFGLLLGS